MEFTKSNTEGVRVADGNSIADFLTRGGLAVSCTSTHIAPQVVTYGMECEDIFDFQPNKAKRLVKLLGVRNHVSVSFVDDTPDGDFAIEMQRNPRGSVLAGDVSGNRTYIGLGVDTNGEPVMLDIAQAPHVLIAGTTGAGKSVLLNSIISQLVNQNTPEQCELVLIDPKRVEFGAWAGIPHLRQPVVQGSENAIAALKALCDEMDGRYDCIACRGCKTAEEAHLSRIVCVIDELADLMLTSKKAAEDMIVRIAQLGRAAGIHLVVATQSPRATVVTGLIKANLPCKIALTCNGVRESMVILDHKGAEQLLGAGDAIIRQAGAETRFQAALTPQEDVLELVQEVKSKYKPIKRKQTKRNTGILKWILTGE